jgi:uncharacterized protein YggE
MVAVLALPVFPAASQEATSPPRLSVNGSGAVTVAPDRAQLRLGVEVEDATAAGAMDRAAAQMAEVMAALAGAGVAPDDIRTTDLTLNPVYPEPTEDNLPVALRYRAGSDLEVTVNDLSALGTVIDAAARAGGNRFAGIVFLLAEPDAAQDAARLDAVADALAKANLLAGAAGHEIVALEQISEGGADFPGPMAMADSASLRAMPVAPGQLEVRADVRMVFTLRPVP